jgi:hypothetical protein
MNGVRLLTDEQVKSVILQAIQDAGLVEWDRMGSDAEQAETAAHVKRLDELAFEFERMREHDEVFMAYRKIVKDIACASEDDWDEECPLCGAGPGTTPIQHEQRCVIYRARVLLENEG